MNDVMDNMMKECMKPHALAHGITGLGVGLLAAHFWPGLAGLWVGVGVLVLGIIVDFVTNPAKK